MATTAKIAKDIKLDKERRAKTPKLQCPIATVAGGAGARAPFCVNSAFAVCVFANSR